VIIWRTINKGVPIKIINSCVRLFFCVAFQLCQQLVGIQILNFFADKIFVALSNLPQSTIPICIFISQLSALVGAKFSIHFIDRVVRRVLLISGCMLICLIWALSSISISSADTGEFLLTHFFNKFNLHRSDIEPTLLLVSSEQASRHRKIQPTFLSSIFFGIILIIYSFTYSFSFGLIK
jgi:hypothetical protein